MAAASWVTIHLPCKLGWTQLSGYDNRGNANSSMKLAVEVTSSHEIKAVDFTKTVTESSRQQYQKEHAEASVKATWSVIEASVSTGIEHSTTMKDMLSSTSDVAREENSKSSKTVKQEFAIGPNDRMFFYQRVFKGPGISCTLGVTQVSSDDSLENKWTDVDMTIIARQQRFIKHMDVGYSDGEAAAPDDHVCELSGLSWDINYGKEGKYVWMVPIWTYNSDEAATGFEIRIQKDEQPGLKDLAKGAGGWYRYVHTNHDTNQIQRVTDAILIRSSSSMSADEQMKKLRRLGKGWVPGPRDINGDRGGDFLYLAYKVSTGVPDCR